MAKRKNLGFNGIAKVYVSTTGIPKTYINELRKAWNETPLRKDASRELKTIKILNLKGRGGSFNPKQSSVDVSCIWGVSYTKFAFVHELAHAVFNRKSRLDEDAIKKFISTISKLPPITKYVRKFYSADKNRWNSYDIYYDEYHSAIAQTLCNYYNPEEHEDHRIIISSKDFETAKQAYLELHKSE